ncbi:synaptobrevin-domain-containing protein, partial [Pelagophyceae sp. CCMP2097]
DQLHHTLAKVEQVKVVMQDSIEIALQNCVSLESIDQKADELQSQAGMFKTRAKKLRSQMWWKKCKVQLMLTALILVVLACIIIPMVRWSVLVCFSLNARPICSRKHNPNRSSTSRAAAAPRRRSDRAAPARQIRPP